MSALAEWVQDALFSHAEMTPCPMDQRCDNCDHPMSGHFGETERWYATQCGSCECHYWNCRHGGVECAPGDWR